MPKPTTDIVRRVAHLLAVGVPVRQRDNVLDGMKLNVPRGQAVPEYILAHELLDHFAHSSKAMDELAELMRRLLRVQTFNVDMSKELASIQVLLASSGQEGAEPMVTSDENAIENRNVFVVHGHDDGSKEAVARLLERLEFNPIILHELPNASQTIIEKFERHADVGYAVVLLTPDDEARKHGDESASLLPRARQNVVFELGYFFGRLNRRMVCALYKPGVEIFSDFSGVLFIEMDPPGAWRMRVARELESAGFHVDMGKVW